MTQRLWVGTRKGLFQWSDGPGGWQIDDVHFLGDPVSMHVGDATGTQWACLTLGHFGAKLRRRRPGESEWQELTPPVFPEGAEVNDGPPLGEGPPKTKPASLDEIWSLELGGADQPGTLWAGTIPGGLFRSTDDGDSWQLIEFLWDRPERSRWFGGGKDGAGIHSVCVDPRDSRQVVIGISCGGIWRTFDAGETWANDATGIRAEYMPPEMAYDPVAQDPHRVAQCAADPDTMWIQHHNGVFLSRDR
ncbi:MAG: exo-alpha-sialidase, partial [Planctomycetales bacterium]|nr:exo-alpha-sialidase [Planctomycetales bacterium]